MTVNNRENKRHLHNFAVELIESLTANPPKVYSETEIADAKYPDFKCQTCGQKGCDQKFAGQYIHDICLDITKKETNKFITNVLHLQVKKQ